jgi:tetratricopeptide (TPR) repeat protein
VAVALYLWFESQKSNPSNRVVGGEVGPEMALFLIFVFGVLGVVLGGVLGWGLHLVAKALVPPGAPSTPDGGAPVEGNRELPTRRCDVCGRLSYVAALLSRQRQSPTSRKQASCLRCRLRPKRRRARMRLLEFLGIVAVGGTGVALFAALGGGLFLRHFVFFWFLYLALLFAWMAVLIWPHEVGHALAAWLLGLRVFQVRIGRGPTVWQGKLRGTRWEINVVPMEGMVHVGHRDTRHFRLKHFLMILAGPLANAILLAVGVWWAAQGPLFRDVSSIPPPEQYAHLEETEQVQFILERAWYFPGLYLDLTFAAANLVLLLLSLVPYTATLEKVRGPSDGLSLCTIPFYSQARVEQTHALYFVLEGMECAKNGQLAEAVRWYERGLAHYPGDVLGGLALAHGLVHLKQVTRARHLGLGLLDRPDLLPAFRIGILDVIVTADVILLNRVADPTAETSSPSGVSPSLAGDVPPAPDLLREVESLSTEILQEALRTFPDSVVTLLATRGCVLVEMGKTEEGLALLQEIWEELQGPFEKAACGCYLALALTRKGRLEEANDYLETARGLGPDFPGVARVARELAQVRAGSNPSADP